MKKKYVFSLVFALFSMCAMSQSGTNSPYSMYGLGKMADQSQGFNRGMNGLGIAFREHNQVNTLNPASYSSVDSLTFIFDLGMSLQNTNFKENGKSKNAKNGDFEYGMMLFRAMKHLGMSFGVLPYSNVGYSFSYTSDAISTYNPAPSTITETTNTMTYYGEGGVHQLVYGVGWEPFKNFSIGANFGYLWGKIYNSAASTYSDTNIKSLSKIFNASVHSYKLDFGMQYTMNIGRKGVGTIGLTYSPGHVLTKEPECMVITSNTQSSVVDSTTAVARNGYSIPTQFGVGLSYNYARKWKVGIDYTLQKWSSIGEASYKNVQNGATVATTGGYKDRHSIIVGGEYCRNEYGRGFGDRIKYRMGVGYTSPYLKINGNDGPRELSMSVGVGIPITNSWNNRSVLNLSLKWQNFAAKNMLTENALMLNIGITFNEMWFSKWKFD